MPLGCRCVYIHTRSRMPGYHACPQMQPTLEDQERHLLVKVIDRIMYKLDDLVRPYVHKILVVIEPLLIDEDYYARIEVRWRTGLLGAGLRSLGPSA